MTHLLGPITSCLIYSKGSIMAGGLWVIISSLITVNFHFNILFICLVMPSIFLCGWSWYRCPKGSFMLQRVSITSHFFDALTLLSFSRMVLFISFSLLLCFDSLSFFSFLFLILGYIIPAFIFNYSIILLQPS